MDGRGREGGKRTGRKGRGGKGSRREGIVQLKKNPYFKACYTTVLDMVRHDQLWLTMR